MRVFCIDPGPHVGAAVWTDTLDETVTATHGAWEWTPAEFYAAVEAWVRASDVVVCEDFKIGGARGQEANVTIEMIGICRYLCARLGVEFVTQRPGAYRFAGSDKLKRLGWYTPGSDHARSASGHLVLYLAESGLLPLSLLLPSTTSDPGRDNGTS